MTIFLYATLRAVLLPSAGKQIIEESVEMLMGQVRKQALPWVSSGSDYPSVDSQELIVKCIIVFISV